MKSLLVVLLLAGSAVAQPAGDDVSKAAALYEVGKRHFDLAEYAAAIESWRDAYRLSSEPLLLFNIAQAYRLSGDCAQANRFYLTYKQMAPKPANQLELDAAMKKCESVQPATGDSTGAVVPVEPVTPSPGKWDPVVVPVPVRDDSRPRPPGRDLQIAGIATAGGGVIAGLLSITYALSAHSKGNKIAEQPDRTEWTLALADLEAAGKSAQTRSRVLGVVSVAAIATGVLVWRFGRQRAVRVDASINARHAQVGLACDF